MLQESKDPDFGVGFNDLKKELSGSESKRSFSCGQSGEFRTEAILNIDLHIFTCYVRS